MMSDHYWIPAVGESRASSFLHSQRATPPLPAARSPDGSLAHAMHHPRSSQTCHSMQHGPARAGLPGTPWGQGFAGPQAATTGRLPLRLATAWPVRGLQPSQACSTCEAVTKWGLTGRREYCFAALSAEHRGIGRSQRTQSSLAPTTGEVSTRRRFVPTCGPGPLRLPLLHAPTTRAGRLCRSRAHLQHPAHSSGERCQALRLAHWGGVLS